MVGDILQPTHLIFILLVALLVLGPKRLPEVGRALGKGIRDFRGAVAGLEEHASELHTPLMDQAPEPPAPVSPATVAGPEEQTDAPPVPAASLAVQPHLETVAVDSEAIATPMAPPPPADATATQPLHTATPTEAVPVGGTKPATAEPASDDRP
jgi:sec-independent protein translocase protein TatA